MGMVGGPGAHPGWAGRATRPPGCPAPHRPRLRGGCARRQAPDRTRATTASGWSLQARPKFPPSRLVEAFGQVVEPLITEITCLRSHELRLFHLFSAYIGSPPGGTTG